MSPVLYVYEKILFCLQNSYTVIFSTMSSHLKKESSRQDVPSTVQG